MTATRIASGDALKRRKGLRLVLRRRPHDPRQRGLSDSASWNA
jgi:hypothetical protein